MTDPQNISMIRFPSRKRDANKLIYESQINFTPDIGKIYFLYEKKPGNRFLSMVPPEHSFWGGYIGKFRLNTQHIWEEL